MPASTKLRPRSLSSAWRRFESLKLALPPSTIVSPGASSVGELLHRLLGRVAGGDHQPDDARRRQHPDDVGRREAALEALADDLLGLVARAVVGHHPMAGLVQAAGHVAAHPAETDDGQLHDRSSSSLLSGSTSALASVSNSSASPASTSVDRSTRATGSSCASSEAKSPAAWAAMSVPKVSFQPGIGRSSAVAAGQLDEAAGRRAALVQLAGRVEEARSVADGHGALRSVAQQLGNRAQLPRRARASAR